jgi:uncharacterized RDD family membrane protein YckC
MNDGLPLAGRSRRLFATLLDCLFVSALTLLLLMIFDIVEDAEDYADFWWVLWVLVTAVASYLILNVYTLWRRGQTLGKVVMGIAIVSVPRGIDSRNGFVPAPLWKLILLRAVFFALLFAIALPPLSLIPLIDQLLIFRKQRRCLHDLVAGTVVIRLANI